MACISIFASLHTSCSAHHFTKKHQTLAGHGQSLGTEMVSHKAISIAEQKGRPGLHIDGARKVDNVSGEGHGKSYPHRFSDERWKNGTWDLNMFVKDGKMDWDGMIVAEAKRRKFYWFNSIAHALSCEGLNGGNHIKQWVELQWWDSSCHTLLTP